MRRVQPIGAGAGQADPAQAGSADLQGRQATRGGDGPYADPLEASISAQRHRREGVRD